MVHLMELHTLIRLHIEGKSVRAIAHEMNISKNTAHKYVRKYEELYQKSLSGKEEDILAFREFLNGFTRKKETRPRRRSKRTPEVMAWIAQILQDEKRKEDAEGKHGEKKLNCSEIHRLAVAQGYRISLSTISNAVKELREQSRQPAGIQMRDCPDQAERTFEKKAAG